MREDTATAARPYPAGVQKQTSLVQQQQLRGETEDSIPPRHRTQPPYVYHSFIIGIRL